MDKNIAKYLSNYAEHETKALDSFPNTKYFKAVAIIPAYKESVDFIKRFFFTFKQQKILLIVVINQPDSDNNSDPQQQTFQQGLLLGKCQWQNKNISLIDVEQNNSSLLLVNRFSNSIPSKQGVGLARKIGADLALVLIANKQITSNWLYSTDADAHLPEQYFSILDEPSKNEVAACFNFYHYSSDKLLHQANYIYEQALHYYVAGLRYANSPYALYTIGSILVINASSYAMVRGFPKRNAGEDFYLINKLAKLGQVQFIPNIKIKLDARTSDRVPFGTGPTVAKILQLQEHNENYYYYDPTVFESLKLTLQDFSSLWHDRFQLDHWYLKRPSIVRESLELIGLTIFVAKQKTMKEQQFNKQLLVWFDAFKTLKFIHALRSKGLLDIDLQEAINKANFTF